MTRRCLLELNVAQTSVKILEKDFVSIKKPDYLAINPMGTVPALEAGSMVMWESGAVLDFLLEQFDTSYTLYPAPITPEASKDHVAKRAKYLQLKQYIIATVYPFVASLVIHKLSKPAAEQDPDYIESATKRINEVFIPVLSKLLGQGPFFLGPDVSAVDLLAGKPLKNLDQLGLLAQSPSLQALFERISSRPSFDKAYTTLAHEFDQSRAIVLVPSKTETKSS